MSVKYRFPNDRFAKRRIQTATRHLSTQEKLLALYGYNAAIKSNQLQFGCDCKRSLIESGVYLRELLGTTTPTILEVGSNDGHDSEELLRQYPEAKLFCFEPEPRATEIWKKRNLNATLLEVAVADKIGTAEFFQSSGSPEKGFERDWDLSGSLNVPTGHRELSPWVTFENRIQVPTITLDSFIAEHPEIQIVDMIWMDVQGGEQNVIKGAQETLKRVRYIYTEFGHWKKPLYHGQMDMVETIEFIGTAWKPLGVFEGYNLLLQRKDLQC